MVKSDLEVWQPKVLASLILPQNAYCCYWQVYSGYYCSGIHVLAPIPPSTSPPPTTNINGNGTLFTNRAYHNQLRIFHTAWLYLARRLRPTEQLPNTVALADHDFGATTRQLGMYSSWRSIYIDGPQPTAKWQAVNQLSCQHL